jgi:hypothetical protein
MPPHSLPELIVVYQRPIDDPFHGGSVHLRGLVAFLRQTIRLRVVAPEYSSDRDTSRSGELYSIINVIKATLVAIKFFFGRQGREAANRRDAVLIFDFYNSIIPFVWCRLTHRPYAYYAQDSLRDLVASARARPVRGLVLLRLLRSRFERELILRASSVIVVSDKLRAEVVELTHRSGNVFLHGLIRTPVPPNVEAVNEWRDRLHLRESQNVVFVGTMDYPPNRLAAKFIFDNLVPALTTAKIRARILLAGKGTETLQGFDSRVVTCLGPVADLDSLLYCCSVGIAPMEIGSGVSGKVADYLTHGLRVVATPGAASGAPAGHFLQICNLPEFASALTQVLIEEGRMGKTGVEREIPSSVARIYFSSPTLEPLQQELSRLLAIHNT